MKRFLSVVLACALCCSLVVPAFAVSEMPDIAAERYLSVDVDVEIERALNGETDVEINTTNFAEAALVRADGTVENVEVYTTTRVLPMPLTMDVDGDVGCVYATTAVASLPATDKTDISDKELAGVTAVLTLYWTDVLGTANNFRGLSGSWTVATDPATGKRASLSKRYVTVKGSGPTARDEGEIYRIYPSSNSFEIKDSEYEDGWWAYTGYSEVLLNSTDWLTLKVSSGQIRVG